MTPLEISAGAAAVFCAALVRGYSGFGFAMLTVSSLALLWPPAEVVPMVLLLEIAASVHMLPSVWHSVEWRSVGWLFAGAALSLPLGVAVLAGTPPDVMRAAVAVVILLACVLLQRGAAPWRAAGRIGSVGTGVVSGLLSGGAAIGGPPVILFYVGGGSTAAAARASLVAYFLAIDVVAAGLAATRGLMTGDVLVRTAVLLLPLVAGVFAGSRRFVRSEPQSFRRFTIGLLAALSLAVLARAALG